MTGPDAGSGSRVPLAERHDALFIDLDGVVYRGDHIVPGAAEAMARARRAGAAVLFLTNNSSLTPQQVVDKLRGLGVQGAEGEILTSGLATASMLRREGWSGRSAFVIGERGVREALEGVDIEILDGEPATADMVVIGWDRSVDYSKLRTGALLVQRGARLVATNGDASYPAPDGLWPGAGAILAAVATTTGARATVVGKPARPLFEAAAEATGATWPLVVGDRLDTDVAGASSMGWDSLLVLSGAAKLSDLPAAKVLPTYLGRDLSFLSHSPPPGRFRPASRDETPLIGALLESGGLSSAGLADRLSTTIVCPDNPDRDDPGVSLAATACLQPMDGGAILRSVAVREDLRGSGLGVLSTAEAARLAREQGMPLLALFTEGAEGFFGRLGFRRVERSALPDAIRTSSHAAEECARSAVAMALELQPGSKPSSP